MKKLLAIIIAAVMIAACSVTAFADTTTVSYDVDPSYTVSIPAAVNLGDADVTADITASDVILEDGKQIKVDLTAASNTDSGSTFNAKNGDSTVTYTITGDEAIAVGDTVATFTANGSKTLTFSAADKSAATVAGSHTETLTFNIAVENAAPATPEYYDKLTSGAGKVVDQIYLLKNFGRGYTSYNSSLTAAQAYALATYQAAIDGQAVYVIMSSQNYGYDIHYALSTDTAATEHQSDLYDILGGDPESQGLNLYYVAQ